MSGIDPDLFQGQHQSRFFKNQKAHSGNTW